MKHRWSIVLAVLALVAAVRAEAQPRPRAGKIEGTITAVNLAGTPQTVTITRGAAAVTLNITASTRIEVEGDDDGSLADLEVGLAAEAKYDPATFNASKIKVEGGDDEVEVQGVAVNATYDSAAFNGLLDLDTSGDGLRDIVVHTTTQTEIRAGRLTFSQAQIGAFVGLEVELEYDRITFFATKVTAEVDDGDDLEVLGTVTSVNLNAVQVTLQTAVGIQTFQLVPGTDIRLNGRPISLPAVQVGDQVTVEYLVNGTGINPVNVALRVTIQPVRPSHLQGQVTAVDPAAGTMTVQTSAGVVLLTVDAGTDLRINGKRSTLTELQAAIAAATAAGRSAKVSARYLARGGVNLATKVHVNVRGRGMGKR